MTTPTPKRDRSKRGTWWTLARRRWAYGIAIALVPLAASIGLITQDLVVPLIALAAAVLGISGLALANPTE